MIELTSIGKHIGWVTLGPASKHGEIKQTEYRHMMSLPEQQLRSSSTTSSISEVRVMSWSVNWPQATNRKVSAWS